MKRTPALFKGLALALCLLLAQPACAQEAPALLEPVSVQMDTFVARIDEIYQIAAYHASVAPHVEELAFPLEGTVSRMHVVIGQEVKAGDVLITLNQEAEQKQIQALEAALEALETDERYAQRLAEVDLAILDWELQALLSQNPPDESAVALKRLDIEEKQLTLEMEAELRALERRELLGKLDALEAKVSKNALYAPFDGQVIHLAELVPGSYVGAYTPLIYLADNSRLSVRSEFISSAYMNNAHALYALIGDRRYELEPVEMETQRYVSLVLSGETPSTVFTILNPDEALCAGQYAGVCIERMYVPDALVVPTNALYSGSSGRYLYVIEDGARVRRDVKTGVANEGMTQITQGLEEGEIVYVKE